MLVKSHVIWNHETKFASTGYEHNAGSANMERSGLSIKKTGSIWLDEDSLCLVIQFQFLESPTSSGQTHCLLGQDSGVYLNRKTGLK